MAEVLLVDDREATARMYEDWLVRLGHHVTVVVEPPQVTRTTLTADPPDVAIVDLSYAGYDMSGLDILLLLYRVVPTCRLFILTNGDAAVGDMLRISWEALPVIVALSKGALFPTFEKAVRAAIDNQEFVDLDLQAWLPTVRDPARSIDRFAGLIGHAGHARLLLALCDSSALPSQGSIAQANGWVVATVRNYTDYITQTLAVIGFEKMGYAELHRFVQSARPIIAEAANAHLESLDNGGSS